jgi:hypothetical protein
MERDKDAIYCRTSSKEPHGATKVGANVFIGEVGSCGNCDVKRHETPLLW